MHWGGNRKSKLVDWLNTDIRTILIFYRINQEFQIIGVLWSKLDKKLDKSFVMEHFSQEKVLG